MEHGGVRPGELVEHHVMGADAAGAMSSAQGDAVLVGSCFKECGACFWLPFVRRDATARDDAAVRYSQAALETCRSLSHMNAQPTFAFRSRIKGRRYRTNCNCCA